MDEAVFEDAEHRQKRVQQFNDRIDFLQKNYRVHVSVNADRLGYNESIALLKRSQGARYRRPKKRVRLALLVELMVNHEAKAIAVAKGRAASDLQPSDIREAVKRIAKMRSTIRGRPSNDALRNHVHAFMALYRETFGDDVRAGLTRNSEYDPHLVAPVDEMLPELFRSVDPSVTLTSIVNIVLEAHASGAIKGKSFYDFFPFVVRRGDAGSGKLAAAPGYKLEHFELLTPIYSS